FSKWISERNRAITAVLRSLECDYLYNGILQHSDVRFAERFLKDYVSGELNYFLWKHMHAFDMLREMLEPYHRLLSILTFPKLGTDKSHSCRGSYVELTPGERSCYTDRFDDPNVPGEMRVTVTLKKVSVGTELSIVQEGIPDVIPPEACCLGWQESLALLA